MAEMDESHKPAWRRVQVVHGDPYELQGRTLIPVARIVSFGRARATVGQDQIAGRSGAWVRISPLSVIERQGDAERTVAVHDATGAAVRGNLVAAVAILIFFGGLRWLVRRRRSGTCCSECESARCQTP